MAVDRVSLFYKTKLLLAPAFVRHDVEHHVVGGAHGFLADAGEVVDALVHVLVDDTLGGGSVTQAGM